MSVRCSLLNHWACYFTFATPFQRHIQISSAKCMCVCQRKILQPSRVRFTTPESSYRITPEYKLLPLERLAATRQCCWQWLHQCYFKQIEFRSDSMKRQFGTRFSPKGFPPNIWSLGLKRRCGRNICQDFQKRNFCPILHLNASEFCAGDEHLKQEVLKWKTKQ